MSKNFCVGVGSGEGSGFVGGTGRTFWVVEVRFGEEPKEGVVKLEGRGLP